MKEIEYFLSPIIFIAIVLLGVKWKELGKTGRTILIIVILAAIGLLVVSLVGHYQSASKDKEAELQQEQERVNKFVADWKKVKADVEKAERDSIFLAERRAEDLSEREKAELICRIESSYGF